MVKKFEAAKEEPNQAGMRYLCGSFSKFGDFLYAGNEGGFVHIFNWHSGQLVRGFHAKEFKAPPSILLCHQQLDMLVLSSQDD